MEFGVIDVNGVEPNVACGAVVWRYGGTLRATIAAKATFDLVHDLPMTLRAPDELQKRDRHVGNNPARSVHIASDAVPYRPRADVTFVGHACAPSSGPVQAALASAASFSVGGALPLFMALATPTGYIIEAVAVASLLFLALLGAVGARTGGANLLRAAFRVTFWGALAMGGYRGHRRHIWYAGISPGGRSVGSKKPGAGWIP